MTDQGEIQHHDDSHVAGASGCLIALVVIAMFVCYGLGIFTGAYGQRYLDARKAKERGESPPNAEADPAQNDAAAQKPLEVPLAEPLIQEHDGARVMLDLATVRFTKVGGEAEVSLPGLVLLRLKVKNLTDKPREFSSWMHAGKDTWLAGLTDDKNHAWEPVHDADPRVGLFLISLPLYRPTLTLAAGEETTSWVAFIAPKQPVSALTLSLPAANFGGEGFVRFDIPEGAVTKGADID
jgi:hypothetical protein